MIESLNRLVIDIINTSTVTKIRYDIITLGLTNFETLVSLAKPDKSMNLVILVFTLNNSIKFFRNQHTGTLYPSSNVSSA